MTKKQWRIIGVVAAIVALASVYYLKINEPELSPSPANTLDFLPETTFTASTTSEVVPTQDKVANTAAPTTKPFPINAADKIASWNYDGYLNDNGPLEAEALQKIKTLKSQLGTNNDYMVYIALAQEYDHLGDGKSAYEYLSRAIAFDTGRTSGVAWHNMGVLMEKLGAYMTARFAHEEAIKIQPNIAAFQISRVELMIYHFPKDTAGVEKAFKDAEAVLGTSNPSLLDLRQRWQNFL